MNNNTGARKGIRFALTAVVSFVLALAGAKYAIVQPITNNIENITFRKTCQLVWSERTREEIEVVDPACAKALY